jgi:hypothetical protein
MQGITGVNEKYRLKMALINEELFCANSVNYLLPKEEDLYYLLGLLNSKIANWYFSKLSTNSNVNGYEVDNIPIKNLSNDHKEEITKLVHKIIQSTDKTKYYEELNSIIYKIYELTEEEIIIIENNFL